MVLAMGAVDPNCPLDGRQLESQSGLYQRTFYYCADCGARYTSLENDRLQQEAITYLRTLQKDIDTKRSDLEQRQSNLERIMGNARRQGLIE